jgi:serine/threonine protein kinase
MDEENMTYDHKQLFFFNTFFKFNFIMLGVLVYEMVMASTPFAPKKADNVTELFTNIAMVSKSGLHLSSRLDAKTSSPEIRSLISQLLKAEPSERIGVQEGSTRRILDHPFFSNIDINHLRNGTIVPEFVPEPQSYHEPVSTLKPVKVFSGDQKQFLSF